MFSRRFLAAAMSISVLTPVAAGLRAQQQMPAEDKEHLDSTGSGFILSNSGYIVTNHHVVDGATSLAIQVPGREKAIAVKVVAEDTENDLAIVKADVPLGN